MKQRLRSGAIARLKRQMVAALRDHLAGQAQPQPPLAGLMLWQAFCLLSGSRQYSGGVPQPICWADATARLALAGVVLLPHHADIIDAMDSAWLEWAAVPADQRSAGALTGEVFDRLF